MIQSQRGQRPFGTRLFICQPMGELNTKLLSPPSFVTRLCRRAGLPFPLRVSGNKHGAGDGGQNLRADGESFSVLLQTFSGMF